MFFRRDKPQEWTFESRLNNLKQFGFETGRDASGKAVAKRGGCAATVDDAGSGSVNIGKAGVLVGGEIAHLVNGGYQMFLRTPSGKELPALAPQLTALHSFEEDLREGLGLTSLYNLALGTTSDDHLYDRVKDRDASPHARPWDIKSAHS
jgi:hypothetical protein